jgi:hypothetical protein
MSNCLTLLRLHAKGQVKSRPGKYYIDKSVVSLICIVSFCLVWVKNATVHFILVGYQVR